MGGTMTTEIGQDQQAVHAATCREGRGEDGPHAPPASIAPGARPAESLADLAEELEGVADTLTRLIATMAGTEPGDEAEQCLGSLRNVCSSLRGAGLLLDSMLSQNTAEHREAFKAFVSALGERMREAGAASRGVFERVSEQMAQLGTLDETQPAEVLAERLCDVMASVRDTAGEVGDHIAAVAAHVDRASQQITSLETLLVETDRKANLDELTGTDSRLALDVALFNAVGDALLCKVARVVQKTLMRTDLEWTLGRYGGEEFGILLFGSPILKTSEMANGIREKIASSKWSIRGDDKGVLQATVSAGVTEHRSGDTVDDVVKRAERALRKAKTSGRNRVTMEYPTAGRTNASLRAAMRGRI